MLSCRLQQDKQERTVRKMIPKQNHIAYHSSNPFSRAINMTMNFQNCGELAPQLLINGSTTTQRVRDFQNCGHEIKLLVRLVEDGRTIPPMSKALSPSQLCTI